MDTIALQAEGKIVREAREKAWKKGKTTALDKKRQ